MSEKSVKFHELFSLRPADKMASRVTGRGVHFEPNVKMHTQRWAEGRPATFPPPRDQTDLTGRNFGRLTVIGFLRRNNKTSRDYWLVRCACGVYESRRAGKILRADYGARCEKCMYIIYLKRREIQLRGETPPSTRKYLLDEKP